MFCALCITKQHYTASVCKGAAANEHEDSPCPRVKSFQHVGDPQHASLNLIYEKVRVLLEWTPFRWRFSHTTFSFLMCKLLKLAPNYYASLICILMYYEYCHIFLTDKMGTTESANTLAIRFSKIMYIKHEKLWIKTYFCESANNMFLFIHKGF